MTGINADLTCQASLASSFSGTTSARERASLIKQVWFSFLVSSPSLVVSFTSWTSLFSECSFEFSSSMTTDTQTFRLFATCCGLSSEIEWVKSSRFLRIKRSFALSACSCISRAIVVTLQICRFTSGSPFEIIKGCISDTKPFELFEATGTMDSLIIWKQGFQVKKLVLIK